MAGKGHQITFSMVHHIRVEGAKFIPLSHENEHNKEHMFAFISGVRGEHVGELFDVLGRWLDFVKDHSDSSTRMTPRLLTAAVLEQYGSVISQKITDSLDTLNQCDTDLQHAIEELNTETPESRIQVTKAIQDLNKKLVAMNTTAHWRSLYNALPL